MRLCALSPNDYRRRATYHKPSDIDGVAEAARQLASTGLRPRDVGAILGLSEAVVLDLLRVPA